MRKRRYITPGSTYLKVRDVCLLENAGRNSTEFWVLVRLVHLHGLLPLLDSDFDGPVSIPIYRADDFLDHLSARLIGRSVVQVLLNALDLLVDLFELLDRVNVPLYQELVRVGAEPSGLDTMTKLTIVGLQRGHLAESLICAGQECVNLHIDDELALSEGASRDYARPLIDLGQSQPAILNLGLLDVADAAYADQTTGVGRNGIIRWRNGSSVPHLRC